MSTRRAAEAWPWRRASGAVWRRGGRVGDRGWMELLEAEAAESGSPGEIPSPRVRNLEIRDGAQLVAMGKEQQGQLQAGMVALPPVVLAVASPRVRNLEIRDGTQLVAMGKEQQGQLQAAMVALPPVVLAVVLRHFRWCATAMRTAGSAASSASATTSFSSHPSGMQIEGHMTCCSTPSSSSAFSGGVRTLPKAATIKTDKDNESGCMCCLRTYYCAKQRPCFPHAHLSRA